MAYATMPGVELDFDRSTISFNGVAFPAVVLSMGVREHCPFNSNEEQVRDCTACLGGDPCYWGGPAASNGSWEDGWCVFVPLENGTMLSIDLIDQNFSNRPDREPPRWALQVGLYSRWAVVDAFPLTTMHILSARGQELRRGLVPGAAAFWTDAEPAWVVELISRMGKKQVVEEPGEEEFFLQPVLLSKMRNRPDR